MTMSHAMLEALSVAERLKDTMRHSYTHQGRHESVAEHSWMVTLMALWLQEDFPEADMDRVIRMGIIHDLGEAFTGDIPTFEKTAEHEVTETMLRDAWVDSLPETMAGGMRALYAEMDRRETLEAKIFKAIDSLEALIQHNRAELSTWTPYERELNLVYADDKVSFSSCLQALREAIREETRMKLAEEQPKDRMDP